jgi:hypothetical protein
MKTLLLLLLASPAFAAPKIETVTVKPGAKAADVELSVGVTRGGSNCEVRVDFGDGHGQTLDFGVATTRTLKHSYRKAGSFKVAVKGSGRTPCEGAREVPVKVAAAAEKKKAEKKKADKKSAPAKKEEAKKN